MVDGLEDSGPALLGPGSATTGEDDAVARQLEDAAAAVSSSSGADDSRSSEPAAPKGGKGKKGKKGKRRGTPAQEAHWERLAELNRERAKQQRERKDKTRPDPDRAAEAARAAEEALRGGSRSSARDPKSGPVFNPDGSPAGGADSSSPGDDGPKLSDLEIETMCQVGWWAIGKVLPKPLGGGALEQQDCEKLAVASMPIVRQWINTAGGPYGLLAVTVLGVFGSRAIAYRMGQHVDGE